MFQSRAHVKILLALVFLAGGKSGFAAPAPAFTATETGPTSSMTLIAHIKIADADRNKTGNFYVSANLNGAWFTPAGRQWIAWNGGALPVYSTGALNGRTIEVVKNQEHAGLHRRKNLCRLRSG